MTHHNSDLRHPITIRLIRLLLCTKNCSRPGMHRPSPMRCLISSMERTHSLQNSNSNVLKFKLWNREVFDSGAQGNRWVLPNTHQTSFLTNTFLFSTNKFAQHQKSKNPYCKFSQVCLTENLFTQSRLTVHFHQRVLCGFSFTVGLFGKYGWVGKAIELWRNYAL